MGVDGCGSGHVTAGCKRLRVRGAAYACGCMAGKDGPSGGTRPSRVESPHMGACGCMPVPSQRQLQARRARRPAAHAGKNGLAGSAVAHSRALPPVSSSRKVYYNQLRLVRTFTWQPSRDGYVALRTCAFVVARAKCAVHAWGFACRACAAQALEWSCCCWAHAGSGCRRLQEPHVRPPEAHASQRACAKVPSPEVPSPNAATTHAPHHVHLTNGGPSRLSHGERSRGSGRFQALSTTGYTLEVSKFFNIQPRGP